MLKRCLLHNGDRLNKHFPLLSVKMFILVLFLAVSGCQSSGGDQSGVQLDWEIEPNPPAMGLSTLNITLRDSTDQLITGAEIELEANMSHPGMQPVMARAEEVEPGKYSASIEFTMGGDWFILVESTLPNQKVIERQINISGVRSQ